MFCTKCGNEMPDGSKFCTKCGAAFGGAATPEAPTAAGSASGQGVPAVGAPEAAATPKKKRGALVAGIAAAAVVALAAVGIAVANPFAAPEPAPEPASAPVEEPAAEPEAADPEPKGAVDAEPAAASEPAVPALPAVWFGAHASDGFSLVNEYGNVTVPAVSDAVLKTPFAGGFSLGTWETSEYDAEWDAVHDE